MDIVLTVLDHFGIRKATVLGYDWGGGIAWSLAAASPKRVSCIVAFHSTYTADKKRPELQAVRCKNLVLWAPPDSFHPLAWGKAFVKLLRRAELQVRTTIVRWCLAAERCFDATDCYIWCRLSARYRCVRCLHLSYFWLCAKIKIWKNLCR